MLPMDFSRQRKDPQVIGAILLAVCLLCSGNSRAALYDGSGLPILALDKDANGSVVIDVLNWTGRLPLYYFSDGSWYKLGTSLYYQLTLLMSPLGSSVLNFGLDSNRDGSFDPPTDLLASDANDASLIYFGGDPVNSWQGVTVTWKGVGLKFDVAVTRCPDRLRPVPISSTFYLLGSGLVALIMRKRRTSGRRDEGTSPRDWAGV